MSKLEIIIFIFLTLLCLVAIVGGLIAQYLAFKTRAMMIGLMFDEWERVNRAVAEREKK